MLQSLELLCYVNKEKDNSVNRIPIVLQVLPALRNGGVEKATLDWSSILSKQNNTVPNYVVSAGGELVKVLEQFGGIHIDLPLETKNPWVMMRNACHLKKIILQHNIQLIHARSRAPAWSALIAARQLRIPFITTYHGVYNSGNFLKKFYNSVMVRGDEVIAISKYIGNLVEENYQGLSSSINIVPEGTDVTIFDPAQIKDEDKKELRHLWQIPDDKYLILLPGRLTSWKGQEVLAKALIHLSDLPICTVFLGSDQGRVKYSKRLKEMIDPSSVRFIEGCQQMPVAYAAADVVLSCSIEPEAYGRVTAEALAMGRPYIGTCLGATPELCLDNVTGFLIPPKCPLSLAEKIRHVLRLSLDQKNRMGSKSRHHIVKNFSLEQMTKLTFEVYKKAIFKKF